MTLTILITSGIDSVTKARRREIKTIMDLFLSSII